MRKIIIGLTALAIIGSACAKSTANNPASGGASASASVDAATCAQAAALYAPGKLTIGTDNPAYPPYFVGQAPKGSVWKLGDPTTGKGFESAMAYAVAEQMGFTKDQVEWTSLPYTHSYAPGPKKFDMYLAQVSYKPARTAAADLSDSYYDVTQALVAVKATPIASATSIAELKSYKLGAPLGTTSADYITSEIGIPPATYQSLSDSVAALNAKQVDGIVVDLPTALYIADPYVQEVKNSTVVGQFPNPAGSTPEHFSFVLPKGSPLTPCVNAALATLSSNGQMQQITQTWLSEKTNVGKVPVFTP
jgi:polar amino acid transport system substrate-binding protein